MATVADNSTANAAMARMRADRIFYSAVPIAVAAIVFAGFAPSWFLRPMLGTPQMDPLTLIAAVHGTVFTSWIALTIVQPLLIASGHRSLHRALGYCRRRHSCRDGRADPAGDLRIDEGGHAAGLPDADRLLHDQHDGSNHLRDHRRACDRQAARRAGAQAADPAVADGDDGARAGAHARVTPVDAVSPRS